ncbi:hypothetical protein MTYM_01524 [Methylococcales bacterium]|nr:hypothetical protein MTYM_01524 [Methylococcales bacterium]
MRDIAIFLIVIASCVASLRKPYYGFLCWVWLSLMNPHRLAYGWVQNMPLAQWTVIFTLVGTFLYKEKAKLFQHPIVALQILFVCWMATSTVFAMFPEPAYFQFTKVVKIQFGVLLSYVLIDSKEKINGLIVMMFMSVGFYGVKGGIHTLMHGGANKIWGPPGTFVEDNNALALAILMAMPLGAYLITIASNKLVKNSLLGALGTMGVSVLGSSSRGAFLGLISVIIFWMRKANGKQKIMVFILAIFIGTVAAVFMPQQWWDRMNTVKTYEKDGSSMGRINAWWCAYNAAKDNITGVGFDYYSPTAFAQYAPNPTDVHAAHSIYFQVLGEHGFLGFILFMIIAAWGWVVCGGIIHKTKNVEILKWANDLARMIQLSLIAYFSAGAFLSLAYYDLYWQLIGIAVILKTVVEKALLKPATSMLNERINPVNKAKSASPSFVRPTKSIPGNSS